MAQSSKVSMLQNLENVIVVIVTYLILELENDNRHIKLQMIK